MGDSKKWLSAGGLSYDCFHGEKNVENSVFESITFNDDIRSRISYVVRCIWRRKDCPRFEIYKRGANFSEITKRSIPLKFLRFYINQPRGEWPGATLLVQARKNSGNSFQFYCSDEFFEFLLNCKQHGFTMAYKMIN